MRWPSFWQDHSWEDRSWYALLVWNLLALVYLVVRTPSDDAAWIYRITLWADIAALAWWVGRSVQCGLAGWRGRRCPGDEEAGDTPLDQAAEH